MSRIRVCHILTDLAPAGTERSVYELARRLDRERFDVRVIALRGGAVAGWLAEAGVDVEVLGVRHKLDVLKFPRLVRMLQRKRPDVVHTHLFHADLVGRLAARLVGVGHLVHTVRAVEQRWRPWQFAWARLMADACDRTVCISQAVRDHYQHQTKLPAWRLCVIRNGVAADAWPRDPGVRLRMREQRAIDADEVVGACVGRLHPDKGVDVLAEAMHQLGDKAPWLLLAGDGPMRHEVRDFVRRHTRAEWLGHVDDVHAILSTVNFLVVPSRTEGFGMATAEAMAAGLPVVASRAGGLAELVVDGETGLLVEPENPAALAEAMARLAGDSSLRDRLGQAGQRRIAEQFGIDATVQAHETLYAEVVNR